MKQPISQDDLQHIEHVNKVLEAHLEFLKLIDKESTKIFNEYAVNLVNFVNSIRDIRHDLGTEVGHITKSTRELKVVTSGTSELIAFVQAVRQLDLVLTPELVIKLRKLGQSDEKI